MAGGPITNFAHSSHVADVGTTEPRAVRWVLSGLAVLFLLLFIVLPAVNVFAQALANGWDAYRRVLAPEPPPAEPQGLSFAERRRLLREQTPEQREERRRLVREHASAEKNWNSIKLTLIVAAVVVPFNLVFGVAAAWAIAKFRFKGRSLLVALIDLPFSVSPVVAGLVFVLLMGRQGFLEVWSTSLRLRWLAPGVAALPAAIGWGLLILLVGIIAGRIGRALRDGRAGRRLARVVRRTARIAAAAVAVLVIASAYLAGEEWTWKFLAPSGWRVPDPASITWRGFGNSWWPLEATESYHGVIFTPVAIVLASIFVTFPFIARSLIPLMESQGTDEELAALSLGASGWRTFWKVTLPNVKWALLYGVILCTARAFGEFGAVSVVSGHIDSNDTMPLRIEKLWNEYDTQAAFTVASLLASLAVVTLIVKAFIEWRTQRRDAPAVADAEISQDLGRGVVVAAGGGR